MEKANKERTMNKLVNFFKDESGAAAVEYGLLVALIAVVIIAAVTTVGTTLSAKFNSVSTSIGSQLINLPAYQGRGCTPEEEVEKARKFLQGRMRRLHGGVRPAGGPDRGGVHPRGDHYWHQPEHSVHPGRQRRRRR